MAGSALVETQRFFVKWMKSYVGLVFCLLLIDIAALVGANSSVGVLYVFNIALLIGMVTGYRLITRVVSASFLGAISLFLAQFAQLQQYMSMSSYVVSVITVGLMICLFLYRDEFLPKKDFQKNIYHSLVEIRREIKRIDWPSQSETLRFVMIVGVSVIVASLFWWVIDQIITRVLSFLLHQFH